MMPSNIGLIYKPYVNFFLILNRIITSETKKRAVMEELNKTKKNWARPVIVSLSIKSETTKGNVKGAYERFSNDNNPGPPSS